MEAQVLRKVSALPQTAAGPWEGRGKGGLRQVPREVKSSLSLERPSENSQEGLHSGQENCHCKDQRLGTKTRDWGQIWFLSLKYSLHSSSWDLTVIQAQDLLFTRQGTWTNKSLENEISSPQSMRASVQNPCFCKVWLHWYNNPSDKKRD